MGLGAPVLMTPPPPGSTERPGPEALAKPWLAISIRNQVIDRLVNFNINHVNIAWQPRSGPVCPHALAFLFADPHDLEHPGTGETHRTWQVAAATLVVPDTPDVRDAGDLIYRLTRLANERYVPSPGGFDPKTHMSVHHDPTSGTAQYIGVALSTLDTLEQSWEQACQQAQDVDDLGGRTLALLADHTALLVDRGPARRARGDLGIHCTGQLNYHGDLTPRLWTHHPSVATMPAEREVWELLHKLHMLTYHQPIRPTL